jgi:adenylate cyclase
VFRRVGVTAVCAAIAVVIACLRLVAPVPIEVLDRKLLDFRHLARGPVEAGPDVVIVAIDETSLAQVGRWPWPRARLAELVDRLADDAVAAIGFDVVFDQPMSTVDRGALEAALDAAPARSPAALRQLLQGELNDDARLEASLRRSGRVVLAHFFEFGGAAEPDLAAETARLPELTVLRTGGAEPAMIPGLKSPSRAQLAIPSLREASAGAGYINFLPDPDGIYRRAPLALAVGDRLLPSFALEVLRVARGGGGANVTLGPGGIADIRLQDFDIPVDGAGQLWIDFLGPPKTFPQVSAADVLAGRVPREELAGRIAVVGFTAAGFDEVPTPFAAVVPGVEVQATVLDNVLHGRMLRRPWWLVPLEAVVVLLLGLLVGPMLRRLRAGWGAVAALLLAVGYLGVTQWLFVRDGLALGAVYPLAALVFCTLGGAVYLSVVEEGEKRKIRDAFGRYVNREVADLIASDPARLRLGGERRPITVLFSDIRGFTGLSERLPPDTLGEMLSRYLGEMTDVVFARAGLLDKYIGDAVMAFWGAPMETPDHAARCCNAALDMQASLARLNESWEAAGLPRLVVRIGISTGEAVVGNFGSARRFSYTAVGDVVNLASRLEHLNEDYDTRIMLTDATLAALGDDFICREIDHVQVRGRAQAATVYELIGRRADDGDGSLARRAAAFEEAVRAARAGDLPDALGRLEKLAAVHPRDAAVARLLERCRRR